MLTPSDIKALADALDLLHDFVSNHRASAEHYEILDSADAVFYKLKEEVTE